MCQSVINTRQFLFNFNSVMVSLSKSSKILYQTPISLRRIICKAISWLESKLRSLITWPNMGRYITSMHQPPCLDHLVASSCFNTTALEAQPVNFMVLCINYQMCKIYKKVCAKKILQKSGYVYINMTLQNGVHIQ